MLQFTTGDMFEVAADVRVNTVNCVGVMGKGVALVFKERYPAMFKDYRKACKDGLVRPGHLHIWQDRIVNFPTKRHWRNGSHYCDIGSGLVALRRYLATRGNIRVTLPALGCGNGGLNWNVVSAMVRRHLSDLEAMIFVFEPNQIAVK